MNDNKCFQVIWIRFFLNNNLLLVEQLQKKLYAAESLGVNKCDLKGLKRFRSGSNHEGQIRAIF